MSRVRVFFVFFLLVCAAIFARAAVFPAGISAAQPVASVALADVMLPADAGETDSLALEISADPEDVASLPPADVRRAGPAREWRGLDLLAAPPPPRRLLLRPPSA
ncbi:MAG: hypothetical protein HZB64_04045 [Rhodocyclales bacterium]|nr:hypothetical protein [Rhodocyclales bacterium]